MHFYLFSHGDKLSNYILDNMERRRSFEAKKCKVCDEKATSHLNYGGVSCSSCREFFRRSTIKLHR